MLQQDTPVDLVIATGVDRTIREFCEVAFDYVGLDWRQCVTMDEQFLRPAEVEVLRGDPSRAEQLLGWKPEVSFEELVHLMVDRDLQLVAVQADR